MKYELEDVIAITEQTLICLKAHRDILSLPNCSKCEGGLDICPGVGQMMRFNCPAFRPKADDDGQVDIYELAAKALAEHEAELNGASSSDDDEVEFDIPEDTDEKPNCPDDPKLKAYLKTE